jgi:hypothetical protein
MYLFPPFCGRVLYVLNLPSDMLTRRIVTPMLYHTSMWKQEGRPTWEFTLPVADPEAVEPRRIIYAVQEGDVVFFTGVVLLWYWVGSRLDEYLHKRRGMNQSIGRTGRTVELVLVAAFAAGLAADCIYRISVWKTWFPGVPPSARLMGEYGFIWVLGLAVYFWIGVGELRSASKLSKDMAFH